MARLVDENFEGTGYEEVWTETVSGGCTLDEDSTIPGTPPPGAGSQCQKAALISGSGLNVYAVRNVGSGQNISYVRAYFYLENEALADGNSLGAIRIEDASAQMVGRIQFGQNAGQLQLRFQYYSSGAIQSTAWVNMSLTTWYRLEFKYDLNAMAWEWRIDGTTQHSGSLASATRTPQRIVTGFGGGIASSGVTTMYTDLVVWDDANWPGAESGFQPVWATPANVIIQPGLVVN